MGLMLSGGINGFSDRFEMFADGRAGKFKRFRECANGLVLDKMQPSDFGNHIHFYHSRILRQKTGHLTTWGTVRIPS